MNICSILIFHHVIQAMTLNTIIWDTIEHLLMDATQLFIPITKVHSHQHPKSLWFNSEIRHNIKQLGTLRRQLKHHPTQHILNTIGSLEKTLQVTIAVAKQTNRPLNPISLTPLHQLTTKYFNILSPSPNQITFPQS